MKELKRIICYKDSVININILINIINNFKKLILYFIEEINKLNINLNNNKDNDTYKNITIKKFRKLQNKFLNNLNKCMNIKLTDDSNPFYYKLTKKHISSYHEDNSYNNDSPSDIYGSTYNYIYFNLNNGLEYIFSTPIINIHYDERKNIIIIHLIIKNKYSNDNIYIYELSSDMDESFDIDKIINYYNNILNNNTKEIFDIFDSLLNELNTIKHVTTIIYK